MGMRKLDVNRETSVAQQWKIAAPHSRKNDDTVHRQLP
jgi:hypothetical protein